MYELLIFTSASIAIVVSSNSSSDVLKPNVEIPCGADRSISPLLPDQSKKITINIYK